MGGVTSATLLPACGKGVPEPASGIKGILPSMDDAVLLADGLGYKLLISWGDTINALGEKFGFNNDYLDFVQLDNNPDDYLLWVNHEQSIHGYFLTPEYPSSKTREEVDTECRDVGGSIVRIKKNDGEWQFQKNDTFNRRIDALTEIPIVSTRPIRGKTVAQGTLANCAGGKTPWNTILTCEENYHYFIGEVDLKNNKRSYFFNGRSRWDRYYDMPPEHYGWVVEIDLFTGAAKKHTSMGRFSHESATVVPAEDGRCVVYTADDKTNEHLYKFIADKPGSLEHGTLYVADTENGKWLPLDVNADPRLSDTFSDQLDMLIRTREAANIVGASPLDRPEDIERDPNSGAVFVTLTKNEKANRPHGSILKIFEKNNDPLALNFEPSTFLSGGKETGFACPDNLAFDKKGNLWFTSDISGDQINHKPYTSFKNNGLFFVPMSGEDAGRVIQLGSAPVHAEFTGLCFSDDGRSLFLSVQHPGEYSKNIDHLESHWPDGGEALPKPSVIVIEGEFLNNHCV